MNDHPLSVKFSRKGAKRVRHAAKKSGKSISAFIAEAAEERAEIVEKVCPSCGRPHKAA